MTKVNRKKIRQILAKYNQCYYCEVYFDHSSTVFFRTIDHIIPIALDGQVNNPENTIECCSRCNMLKGNLTLEDFLEKSKNGLDFIIQEKISDLIIKIAPYKHSLIGRPYYGNSLVGAHLRRISDGMLNKPQPSKETKGDFVPGRIESISDHKNRTAWEFDKRPHETLADANERMRIAALPLLERIKLTLKEPEFNFHETD